MINRFKAAAAAFMEPQSVVTKANDFQSLKKRVAKLEESGPANGLAQGLTHLDNEWKRHPNRWIRIRDIADVALAKGGVKDGVMLEIGGRQNPRSEYFSNFKYFALDLEEQPDSPVPVEVGNITDCPHIPDNTYDFVFSLDVFEHIDKPWLAGSEITRILKPGGVTMHSTLFAWRYHPCPGDYFRYTPEGLAGLFPDLECVHKSFDYTERRRNVMGSGKNAMTPDILGGWRENVRVNYAGIKPAS